MREVVYRKKLANFVLDDLSLKNLLDFLALDFSNRKVAIGIHITTLNSVFKREIDIEEFSKIDYVYADGWSILSLGRLSGLRNAERIATTDLFPLLLSPIGKPLRVEFIGGEPDIGSQVISNWNLYRPQDYCNFYHGYQENWSKILKQVRANKPDIVFLGLGMPLELKFINAYFDLLPHCLILTCGGMLRILAGKERRSPKLVQQLRLEWLFRLITTPRRTFSRYSIGFWNWFKACIIILRDRV